MSDHRTRLLISGAGVAGMSAAYWLSRYGFAVTVVERAGEFRPGGQAVDVRGPALEVADRMGILDEARRLGTGMRGMTMIDSTGRELFRSTERTITGGKLGNPDIEIMRDDLSRLLRGAAEQEVEYMFDDSIATLTEHDDGVDVTFEHAAPRGFDLVVGADGLHSTVRALAFGPESTVIEHLGMYLAVFTTPNFLDLDNWQIFLQGDDVGGAIMSARGNTEARVFLGFGTDEPLDYDLRDVASHRRILADHLSHVGWRMPTVLEHMWHAPDFHFDSMSQIKLDAWSRGRIVLLGDAACCGSPLSGQGTSMAMIGAYVLAGELRAAKGDHEAAFAAYDGALRDYAADNQQLAIVNQTRMRAQAAAITADRPEAVQAIGDHDIQEFGEVVNALRLKDYA